MIQFKRETSLLLMGFLFFLLFPNFVLASKIDKVIDEKISKMSLEEKAGQLVMFGFPQTELSPDLQSFIKAHKPGSFLLFKRNITNTEQIKKLNQDLYRLSYQATNLPPLIAVDQEGGSVSRIPIFPKHPNAISVGQTQNSEIANQVGYHIGKFLRELGFNINLAPVLDLSSPHISSFIGERSFGSDPELVSQLTKRYSDGLLRSHVLPTAKHFPGSGSIKTDPHDSIVKNLSTKDDLNKRDLRPYHEFKKLGRTSAVMLSHFIYPDIDNVPATFSSKIIKNILREEIGFKGLVISDDLQMKGAKSILLPEEGAIKALLAGADIVMLSWSQTNQKNAIQRIKKAISSQELSSQELNEKLKRILYAKAFTNSFRNSKGSVLLSQNGELTSPAYKALEENIVDSHIRNSLVPQILPTKNREPAQSKKAEVCLFSFSKNLASEISSQVKEGIIKSLDLNQISNRLQCGQPVAIIKTLRHKNNLKALSPSLKKKILVVNMGSPLGLKNSDYKRVIQLSFQFDSSAKKIAQHLDEMLRDSDQIAKR